ncbi:RNA polymerase ECF-type sigma factor [Filimonas lacunae]|nr:RNA polymerase ECF-type sigma factor [Filimonas lacunae]
MAGGDETAFKQLVDLYWLRVFRNILALTKQTETAQEITQDIFLKIWQHRDKLLEIKDLMAYIYVLGRNQVFSAMRKKLLETVDVGRGQEDFAESRNLPELELEYKETWRLIHQAIDHMPPKQQEVFRLSRIEGLSNQEIAQKLNVSNSTVKSHIVAGLNTVRVHLATSGGDHVLLYLLIAGWELYAARQ